MHDTLNIGKGFVAVIAAPEQPTWKVKDVAEYFGVKRTTVYHWVYRGLLKAHKTPGGRLRFVEAEVKMAQKRPSMFTSRRFRR